MKKLFFALSILVLSLLPTVVRAQFTRADTLRGSITPERACYDVTYYQLDIKIDTLKRAISGSNTISFKVVESTTRIQVDLFKELNVDKIIWKKKPLKYKREGNAIFIDFPKSLPAGSKQFIEFHYSGIPRTAIQPPWSGGFTWSKTKTGHWMINTSCQGIGASIWWPNKDHQSDEPDEGMTISVTVPGNLMNVSNGRLREKVVLKDGNVRYDWVVTYPINNYGVALNISNYVHFSDTYNDLTLDYYVLPENLDKAREQFKQVKPMLACFEEKFGAYPFPRDGFKLIETSHLGMEHQSAIGYGNGYVNGYKGMDWTGVGISPKFDFIIIHESGHEWFGNSITSNDIADMWLHEGFTTYAEAVYVECLYGKQAAYTYINGYKNKVHNDRPIIPAYGVHQQGPVDMYFKGALFLHTLRNVLEDDVLWWSVLKEFYQTYQFSIIENKDVIEFFSGHFGRDLTPIFDQYLKHKDLPVLELRIDNGALDYRWRVDVSGFEMPVKIVVRSDEPIFILPTSEWQSLPFGLTNQSEIQVILDEFFINVDWEE